MNGQDNGLGHGSSVEEEGRKHEENEGILGMKIGKLPGGDTMWRLRNWSLDFRYNSGSANRRIEASDISTAAKVVMVTEAWAHSMPPWDISDLETWDSWFRTPQCVHSVRSCQIILKTTSSSLHFCQHALVEHA